MVAANPDIRAFCLMKFAAEVTEAEGIAASAKADGSSNHRRIKKWQ